MSASEDLKIRNLGPASMRWLATIGVRTLGDLREMGSVDAYRLMALRGVAVSLNLLWAMEAALTDRHWQEVSEEEKQHLRARLAEPWDPARYLDL